MQYNNYKRNLKECQHDYEHNVIKKKEKYKGHSIELSYCSKCQEEIGRKLISSNIEVK